MPGGKVLISVDTLVTWGSGEQASDLLSSNGKPAGGDGDNEVLNGIPTNRVTATFGVVWAADRSKL